MNRDRIKVSSLNFGFVMWRLFLIVFGLLTAMHLFAGTLHFYVPDTDLFPDSLQQKLVRELGPQLAPLPFDVLVVVSRDSSIQTVQEKLQRLFPAFRQGRWLVAGILPVAQRTFIFPGPIRDTGYIQQLQENLFQPYANIRLSKAYYMAFYALLTLIAQHPPETVDISALHPDTMPDADTGATAMPVISNNQPLSPSPWWKRISPGQILALLVALIVLWLSWWRWKRVQTSQDSAEKDS